MRITLKDIIIPSSTNIKTVKDALRTYKNYFDDEISRESLNTSVKRALSEDVEYKKISAEIKELNKKRRSIIQKATLDLLNHDGNILPYLDLNILTPSYFVEYTDEATGLFTDRVGLENYKVVESLEQVSTFKNPLVKNGFMHYVSWDNPWITTDEEVRLASVSFAIDWVVRMSDEDWLAQVDKKDLIANIETYTGASLSSKYCPRDKWSDETESEGEYIIKHTKNQIRAIKEHEIYIKKHNITKG